MTAPNAVSSTAIADQILASIANRRRFDEPYRHFLVETLFPETVCHALRDLPFAAPLLEGLSGKRELHNDTRRYFDAADMARFPLLRAVAEALQSPGVTRAIAEVFEAPIDDTFLRLEYAQDIDGFWLEPHTDLGVKKFTGLIYLSEDHDDLGTDIYRSREEHVGRSPFKPNSAMIFVPSDKTWHGFERRPIAGVRKSVILNYVTHEWRAREQLSFPEAPVRI
ncbi:MAG TPA: 2OG-Fe(II) oxygenase [Beijerinckiaceae bacterium]|jgi:hypothetical protein|nr:2OG-Fe(II) oxygenase [Beijerinckiaceae bacterium]